MTNKFTAEDLDEYVWSCLEDRRQLLVDRPPEDASLEELTLCNAAIAVHNMRDPQPLNAEEQEGIEKITAAVDWHVGAGGLSDEQVRVLTYVYSDICYLATRETEGVELQLHSEYAETKRELGEVFPWLLEEPEAGRFDEEESA